MHANIEHKTDEELVSLTLEDKEYFGELIERYNEKLRRYIRRLLSAPEHSIDDVVQESFIKAYVNLNGFDAKLSFSSWMYRITHNEAINFYRKHDVKKKGFVDVDDEILETIAEESDIEEQLHEENKNKLMQKALDTLDDNYREVIVLKFFEHKDYNEIADILKKPPGTIGTLINRAKAKMRSYIEKNHE